MKVISLVTQKGGCGKTTLTTNLAVAASSLGYKVLLLDTDPQTTTLEWWDDREENDIDALEIDGKSIPKAIDVAKEKIFDFVFIDTPARAEPVNAAAIKAADFCIIPCRPTLPDMRAQSPTAESTKKQKKKGAFIITQTLPRSPRIEETRKGLSVYGLPVASQTITNLVAYQDAYSHGLSVLEYEPTGAASQEIKALWEWTMKKMEKLL